MKKETIIITLIDFKGSVPQVLGAKAHVDAEGLFQGSVGGGKLEAKAIDYALGLLKNSESPVCQLVTWNLKQDLGMTCGGVVTLLFEIQRKSNWKIAVFGAGHVAQELVPMLAKLNCEVICIDSREHWLERLPHSENLTTKTVQNLQGYVKELSEDCYFILMTQGHATDLPILSEVLRCFPNSPYIGVIGSKAKAASLKAHLKQMDFNEDKIKKYFCPIGLDFGDNTPVEIAYSVVAQLLQIRDAHYAKNHLRTSC